MGDVLEDTYGHIFRRLREGAHFGLRETARRLELSPSYLSRVELGHQQPLSREKTLEAAALFGTHPATLLRAAARARGEVRVKTAALSDAKLALVTDIERRLPDLTDAAAWRISKMVSGNGGR